MGQMGFVHIHWFSMMKFEVFHRVVNVLSSLHFHRYLPTKSLEFHMHSNHGVLMV